MTVSKALEYGLLSCFLEVSHFFRGKLKNTEICFLSGRFKSQSPFQFYRVDICVVKLQFYLNNMI